MKRGEGKRGREIGWGAGRMREVVVMVVVAAAAVSAV